MHTKDQTGVHGLALRTTRSIGAKEKKKVLEKLPKQKGVKREEEEEEAHAKSSVPTPTQRMDPRRGIHVSMI